MALGKSLPLSVPLFPLPLIVYLVYVDGELFGVGTAFAMCV